MTRSCAVLLLLLRVRVWEAHLFKVIALHAVIVARVCVSQSVKGHLVCQPALLHYVLVCKYAHPPNYKHTCSLTLCCLLLLLSCLCASLCVCVRVLCARLQLPHRWC